MKQRDAFEEGMHAGIIYALIVLLHDGQETIAWEILRGCDDKAIRRIAKEEGDTQVVKFVDDFRKERRESKKYREKVARRRKGVTVNDVIPGILKAL